MSTWEARDWDPRLILTAADMHASSSCMALNVNLQAHRSRCHEEWHTFTGYLSPWAGAEPSLQSQS